MRNFICPITSFITVLMLATVCFAMAPNIKLAVSDIIDLCLTWYAISQQP